MRKTALQREGERATRLLEGRTVETVWRHRETEVALAFADGTRLFVNATTPLGLSITGSDSDRFLTRVSTPPSARQVDFARSLGIDATRYSARVVSALIQDRLEQKAAAASRERGIRRGVRVRYTGPRTDMPETLVVSTVSRNGFVFFRQCSKYCRPWFLEVDQPLAKRK